MTCPCARHTCNVQSCPTAALVLDASHLQQVHCIAQTADRLVQGVGVLKRHVDVDLDGEERAVPADRLHGPVKRVQLGSCIRAACS